ncbi:TetR family transcriptional regulator [Providencia hangzhouensis]|uniref:TetR family transcriptional regulator n=1 Tax=Providencia hangzhouensis TaxID=3031799 RepID=UPI0034DD32EF
MNTLRTQQHKYSVSGESVNQFKSYKGKDLTPQQRFERMEKKFNTVVYLALALGVAVFVLLLNR